MDTKVGTITVATKIDIQSVEKGSKEIKKEFEGVANTAEKSVDKIEKEVKDIDLSGMENKFSSAADKIGGAMSGIAKSVAAAAAAFVADRIIDFGQEAIDLGSDLQEVQNVVDVTFKSMSEKVNKFAQDAAKSAGLSETMAKKYVGTFGAMADSFGFAEKEAYEMSTALTQLTGDVASFYNLDHDEAYTKLKSVFTGETESLKEIGVVMTQTALDAYALEKGLGKVTSEMSEQEKVALRYEFVMEQLSAATGDFERTQEGWANQTRILNLQWESFQGTIGEGLINAFTPAIQFINNDVMPLLQTWADEFAAAFEPKPVDNLREGMDDLKNAFSRADEQFEATTDEIKVTAAMARACAEELLKLEKAGLLTTDAQKRYEMIVRRLNEIMPELNLTINKQTGLLEQSTEAIFENIEALEKKAFQEAELEKYNELYAAYEEAVKKVFDAEYALIELESQRDGLMQQLADATGLTTEQVKLAITSYADLNEEISLADVLLKEYIGLNMNFVPEARWVLQQLEDNTFQQNQLNQEIAAGKELMDQAYVSLDTYGQRLQESTSDAEIAQIGQMTVAESVDYVTGKVQELKDAYDATYESVRAAIDNQISMFDKLSEESEISAEEIVANAKKTTEAYRDYDQNLQTLVNRGVPRELAAQFADCSKESIQTVEVLANASDLTLQEFVAAAEGFTEVQDQLAATIADLYEGTTENLKKIEQEFRDVFGDDIPQEVRDGIRDAQSHIDSLKGKSVNVTVTTTYVTKYQTIGTPSSAPSIGGYPRTYNAAPSLAASYEPETMNALPVAEPYLASGTVVPPMATFPAAAAFSSMRGANNEELIREIVRAENAGLSDGLDDINENLSQILGTILQMNLDGNMIFSSYNDRARKHRIMTGVK